MTQLVDIQNSISWRGFILTRPLGLDLEADESVYMYTDTHIKITTEYADYWTSTIEIEGLEAEGKGTTDKKSLEAARKAIKEKMMLTFDCIFEFLDRD